MCVECLEVKVVKAAHQLRKRPTCVSSYTGVCGCSSRQRREVHARNVASTAAQVAALNAGVVCCSESHAGMVVGGVGAGGAGSGSGSAAGGSSVASRSSAASLGAERRRRSSDMAT